MAIFTDNRIDTEIVACEGYDVSVGGNYDLIMESYADDFAVVEAMHAFDMAELELMKESSFDAQAASPVLEASLKDIWQKIKAAFVKLGQRIMAFFKSVIDYINSLVMSGADFAKKYEERLNKLDLKEFYYDMYDYSNVPSEFTAGTSKLDSISATVSGNLDRIKNIDITKDTAGMELESERNKLKEDNKRIVAKAYNDLAGVSDSEKLEEALFNKFRGTGKITRHKITSVSEFVKTLADTKKTQDAIKAAKTSVDDRFKKIEKLINAAAAVAEAKGKNGSASVVSNGAKQASVMRDQISAFSSVQTMFTKYINAWSKAVSERTRVYKSVCFKAMQHKNPK